MAINCQNIQCLQQKYDRYHCNNLTNQINCRAFNDRTIRNTDHERPMMFPEYRFKHLNYCNPVNLNGYIVCGGCSNCGFNKSIPITNNSVMQGLTQQAYNQCSMAGNNVMGYNVRS